MKFTLSLFSSLGKFFIFEYYLFYLQKQWLEILKKMNFQFFYKIYEFKQKIILSYDLIENI
jgi:hypothetical protein